MQTQIITEAGTVIGIFDPKDEHSHLTGDSEVISKAGIRPEQGQVGERRAQQGHRVRQEGEGGDGQAGGEAHPEEDRDRCPAEDHWGKAAMVGVPAMAALAASSPRAGKIKAKYDASRDVRHYRPASPYYDDGFGKGMPKFMGKPSQSRGRVTSPGGPRRLPKYVERQGEVACYWLPGGHRQGGPRRGAVDDPTTVLDRSGAGCLGVPRLRRVL